MTVALRPSTPSFTFGYWRPWKQESNFFDSWLEYRKDVSLAKYAADTVGNYINQASEEQVNAINNVGNRIGLGINYLTSGINKLSNDFQNEFIFLNRNMDIQIEQEKLSNLLLENIAELLRVPESEKERQYSIELGIKFLVNAQKDEDLYSDALDELLKAEQLMKQDYFVLHRIGIIYLYSLKHIDPEKALNYFSKAAKYASVESDPKAVRLVNVLTNNFDSVNSNVNKDINEIQILASDSYEKAAFAAYVLGNIELAVHNQEKVIKYQQSPQSEFYLAKYYACSNKIAECLQFLEQSIDKDPLMALAVFYEIDLMNVSKVLDLINRKNEDINNKINELIEEWKAFKSDLAINVLEELNNLLTKDYNSKVKSYTSYKEELNLKIIKKQLVIIGIENLVKNIEQAIFKSLSSEDIKIMLAELNNSTSLALEEMLNVFLKIKEKYRSELLEVGSNYKGGIVFYLDKTNKFGLICSLKDAGRYCWGVGILENTIGTNDNVRSGKKNTKIIIEKASFIKKNGFVFDSFEPAQTAARICKELDSSDEWYLPSIKELELMKANLHDKGLGNFQNNTYWSSSEYGDDFYHLIGEERVSVERMKRLSHKLGQNTFRAKCYDFKHLVSSDEVIDQTLLVRAIREISI